MMDISRRGFLKSTVVSSVGIGLSPLSFVTGIKAVQQSRLCVFTKFLQFLDYDKLGDVVAEMGFDGVDLTVRKNGHILPENVKTDLPKATKALRRSGIEISMISTGIVDAEEDYTEDILCTAAEEGIPYYRMGYYKYDFKKTIPENLGDCKRKLEKLERLNRKYGIKGGYQNHSGPYNFVGGPVWDLYYMFKDLSPDFIGIQYDVLHATVEAGYSWPIGIKLIAPWINGLAVMDFIWEGEMKNQQSKPVPLGTGKIDFERLAKEFNSFGFSGPVTVKSEYLKNAGITNDIPDKKAGEIIYSKLKNDQAFVRNLGLI